MTFAVFTPSALHAFIQAGHEYGHEPPQNDQVLGGTLCCLHREGNLYFFATGDKALESLIYVSVEAWRTFSGAPETLARFLERIDRAARAFHQPQMSIPRQWSKYSYKNLVAFFAVPRHLNLFAYRWVAEKLPRGSACFWRLTDPDDELRLQNFQPDANLISELRQVAQGLIPVATDLLPTDTKVSTRLQPIVDLKAVGSGSITKARNFSSWLPHLSHDQLAAINYAGRGALKVRGPAGSGKTLVLELRALKEMYGAIERNQQQFRQLFLTHSWAAAAQVEDSLNDLDERRVWNKYIDVMPLTWLQEIIQGPLPEETILLGEDSLEGKQRQLALIAESIDAIVAATRSTYDGRVGDLIERGIASNPDSSDRLTLAWQLMREFTEVIDAHRLKPGVNSLKRYLSLPRESWMVDLNNVADREFAFAVYRLYVDRLVEEGQLTTDQAIDDFRAYLEGYAWNIRRTTEGYDSIVVDEYHLFNDTERYLLHLLTNNPDEFPHLTLATDPAQSPFAILTGLELGQLSRIASSRISTDPAKSVELSVVHRFTRNIHKFVQHVYGSLPNLVSLGADWTYDLTTASSEQQFGEVPNVYFVDLKDFALEVLNLAERIRSANPKERLAVLGVTSGDLAVLRAAVFDRDLKNLFTLIESREDIDRLGYTHRTIVLTSAEYAAGLQFSKVIVASAVNPEEGYRGAGARRAAISQLYLAVSRSINNLYCVSSTADTEVGSVLKSAIESGVAASSSLE